MPADRFSFPRRESVQRKIAPAREGGAYLALTSNPAAYPPAPITASTTRPIRSHQTASSTSRAGLRRAKIRSCVARNRRSASLSGVPSRAASSGKIGEPEAR
jgi:hypothetical protein